MTCCNLHNRNCEPTSELCCHLCSEADHPDHLVGSGCVAPDLSRQLTAAEIADLPDGTPILVMWSGGNGPHDYVVSVESRGYRWARRPGERRRFDPGRTLDRFVGEAPLTQVWLSGGRVVAS